MFSLTRKVLSSRTLFKKLLLLCMSLMFFVISLGNTPAWALVDLQAQYPINNTDEIINNVPTGKRWIEHLEEDLLPFWTMDTALGEPVGNFPTYRCNDGSLPDFDRPENLCEELKNPVNGIVKPERDYVRAKSRQVFAYGVAYNLTGDDKYFEYAKKGVDYLRNHALDLKNGGAYTYLDAEGNGQPSVTKRISQDMAYAVSGLGYYYYLTRDPDVLEDIIALKDYIFNTYYDKEWDLIAWAKIDYTDYEYSDGTKEKVSSEQRELVSQLDQVYGYMLLLAPILPEPYQSQWKQDLVHLAKIMSEQFYSPDKNIFFGAITDSTIKHLGTEHTDFGHSIKTLWLIYEIGKLTGNYDLTLFAQEAAPKILKEAYLEDGSWGRSINQYGQLETDKEWWILAELDQVAATFSLRDPSYAKYLTTTYPYWFKYIVDHEHKGVWHWVNASNNEPDIRFPKEHSWKNAFHSFEHTMVGYLTGQEIHNKESKLYFAFQEVPEDKTQIRPYIYAAKVKSIKEFPLDSIPNSTKQEVTFAEIR